jgi:hypothetical protein
MCGVGNVARMAEIRNAFRVLMRKVEGKNYLQHLVENWRIILKWILNIISGLGKLAGCCVCGNEHLRFIVFGYMISN